MAVEGVLALALGGVGVGVLHAGEAATATVAASGWACPSSRSSSRSDWRSS